MAIDISLLNHLKKYVRIPNTINMPMRYLKHFEFPIATLIGSTKFKQNFLDITSYLSRTGWIVRTISHFSHIDNDVCMFSGEKKRFDAIYFQYINESDLCIIINPNGYIGLGAWDEIMYAISLNKEILFCEKLSDEDEQAFLKLTELEKSYITQNYYLQCYSQSYIRGVNYVN